MNKEFIPYEQALELKNLGFDEPCMKYYRSGHPEGYYLHEFDVYLPNSHRIFNKDNLMCTAPLCQQAFRWFREKHGWIGGVRLLSHESISGLLGEFTKDKDNNFMMFGASYEEVEFRCFKELIERIKNK